MATKFNNSLVASNSTAAQFRAWATFVHETFLLGFVATADTGQVDLTTVAAPSSGSQSMGYKVYRTNDAMTPVYVKVEYGAGNVAANCSVWITVGTGTNGAGTLTGTILLTRTQITLPSNDAATQQICFSSGAANRVLFALFLSLATYPMWFSLERRKDANIDDVDAGVIIDWGSQVASVHSLCAPFTGVIPTPEIGLQFILSSNNPAAYGSTIPEGLRIPCLGPSEYPGRNIALCMAGDWGPYAEPELTISGDDHTYKHAGPYVNTLRGGVGGPFDVQTRALFLYE